jgi:uncharacterized damage-inducible protein DinB
MRGAGHCRWDSVSILLSQIRGSPCPYQKRHSCVFCSRRSFYDCPSPSDSARTRLAIAFNDTNRASERPRPGRECAKSGACSGGNAFVAMVESANLRDFHDPTHRRRLDRSADWRVLTQRQVSPGSLIVVEVGLMEDTMPAAQQGLTPEFASAYREIMLQGLANEAQTTKKVLAAIPEAKRDFRPDPNARTAWELAWHLANTDVQLFDGIAQLKFDMNAPEAKNKPATVSDLVSWYEKNFARGAEQVRAMKAEQLLTPVDFYGVFNLPAVLYLGFLNNHSIHHRGALATYLRPMGAKVPSIYGGSFDEPWK